MASLKDLRLRIKSVKNTQQITKTMKMVSAAKVRRARMACESARPYAERLDKVLQNLASANKTGGPLLLSGRADVKKVRLIVVGSARGLCGAFNSNVMRHALKHIREHIKAGREVEIVAVGKKVRDGLKSHHGDKIIETYTDPATFDFAKQVGEEAVAAFEAGQCDQVDLVYGKFVSMLNQEPTTQQLAPFPMVEEETAEVGAGVEYEPGEEEILAELLPKNVSTQVFRALLESAASEQAARMAAMDNATRNAGEMIQDLSLKYNRGRQAAITRELIEIISGAEAV